MSADVVGSTILRVRRLPQAVDLPLPRYETAGAAGMDLRAAAAISLPPREWRAVPTGLQMALPVGYEGQVRPRSGLARRHGVTVLNAPGTVDWDYRGEVMVLLVNLSDRTHEISHGDRIAQLVVAPVVKATVREVDELDVTKRGEGGFGSTGS